MTAIFKSASVFLGKLFLYQPPVKEQSYHYSPLQSYSNLSSYHSYVDSIPTREKLNTAHPILYAGQIPFGSTIRQVKNQLGHYTFKTRFNHDQVPRTILLFKRKIAGQNVKIEMHFYKNKLFYFNCIYSYASAADRNRLTEMLIEKYQIETENLLHNAIFDANKNCIVVTEGTDFSIQYFQTNNPFFNKLNEVRYAEYQQLASQKDMAMENLFASL